MILFDSYWTISDIEIFWVIIALVGCVYSVSNVRAALMDVRRLYDAPPYSGHWTWWQLFYANLGWGRPLPINPDGNGRFPIAWAQARVETARLLIQVIFITVGIAAMTVPDIETSLLPTKYVIVGALSRWGFIAASLLVTYQSVVNRRVRKHVLAYAHHEGGDP